MEQIILQLLDKSSVAALAAFAILMLREEMQKRIKDKDEMIACLRADRTEIMALARSIIEVLSRNTDAIGRNTEVLSEMRVLLNRLNGK